MQKSKVITIDATVNVPIEKAWTYYVLPEHIIKWNHASSDWHSPKAENDLRVGGKFIYRMESIDKTQGFDFSGVYTEVKRNELIAYTIDGEDERKVRVTFAKKGNKTDIVVEFDAENENPIEMQEAGWQAILNNFKSYVENN